MALSPTTQNIMQQIDDKSTKLGDLRTIAKTIKKKP